MPSLSNATMRSELLSGSALPEAARTASGCDWLDRAAQRNAGDLATHQLDFELLATDTNRHASLLGCLNGTTRRSVLCQDSVARPSVNDVHLGRVVCELNIGRFQHLLSTEIDAAKRQTVNRLLAEEQSCLKQLLAAGGS